jgi:hypothetical protein
MTTKFPNKSGPKISVSEGDELVYVALQSLAAYHIVMQVQDRLLRGEGV